MSNHSLTASGFSDHLSALNGKYSQAGLNHEKPQFRKPTTEIQGCTESCIYFWDSRDGEALSGWWCAPVVGGEQVWSFNPSKAMMPPATGWRVPWLDQTPNPAVRIVVHAGTAAAKRPSESPQAAQGPDTKQQKTTDVHPQLQIRQKKLLDNLDSQVSNIEKTVEAICSFELNNSQKGQELNRKIHMAKNSITSTRKFIEQQKTQHFVGESAKKLEPVSLRIDDAEKKVLSKETETQESQKARMSALTSELPKKCEAGLQEIESHLETTKDETVVLTCELGEHSSPEDILLVDENASKSTEAAFAKIAELKDYLNECQAAFRTFPNETLGDLPAKCKETLTKIAEFEKELNQVKRMIAPAVAKARQAIAVKKQEEEKEKKKQEEKRLIDMARVKGQRAAEIGLFSDQLVKGVVAKKGDLSLRDIETCQSEMLGLFSLLEADYVHKDTQLSQSLKQCLSKSIGRVKKGLVTLHLKEKDVSTKTQEADDKLSVVLGNAVAEYKDSTEAKDSTVLFLNACGNTPKATPKENDEIAKNCTLAYDTCFAWLCEQVLNEDQSHVAHLKNYLPLLWRKAVTAKKRIAAAAAAKDAKYETDEEKKAAVTKIMNLEVDDLEEALKEEIGESEFTLFVSSNYFICTNICSVTKFVSVEEAAKSAKEVMDSEEGTEEERLKKSKEMVKDAGNCAAGELEMDDVVRVIEVGVASVGGNDIVRMKVSRLRDALSGWINLREAKQPADNLEKYSNSYEIKQETVLTNTYELKGFKVIRRVKKDEKVLALSVPAYNSDAELLRVKVKALTDGAEGWITVKGSHGTLFLQSISVAEAQQKQKQQASTGGLNIQKDAESGRHYIQQDLGSSDTRRKIHAKLISDDTLEAELKRIAESLPESCWAKLDAIKLVREECSDVLKNLNDLNEKTKVEGCNEPGQDNSESLKKEELEALQVAGKLAYEEKDLNEEVTKCDNLLRQINTQVAAVRQEMQVLFQDLQSVKIPQEVQDYLRWKKNQDQAKEDKDEEQPKEPIDSELKPMVLLKYKLLSMQRNLELNGDFVRQTQKEKINTKTALQKKLEVFKKSLEEREMNELAKKMLEEVEMKTNELGDLDKKKKALYSEITGEAVEGSEGEGSENRPVHSASKIACLGLKFEEMVQQLEQYAADLQQWLSTHDPSKMASDKTRFTKMLPQEKATIIKTVGMPFTALRTKWTGLRQSFAKDKEFLAHSLQADILLRSRTEIATYFRKNDARKIFLEELAPENQANKDVEDEENKWVSVDTLSKYMEEALKPEPIPEAVIKKIYCSLVGNVRRPMTLDEFCNLFAKMHYRVLKDTIITDVFDVVDSEFNAVKQLSMGDIVRLVGDVKKLPDGMLRFEAETLGQPEKKGAESPESPREASSPSEGESEEKNLSPISGWVTLKGNRGSTFFQLHTPGYRVVKPTVLTDIFHMKNFKPVVRLNVGDQVRAIGFPRREPQSGLLRVKATTVGHKKDSNGKEFTGYVTVEGNQNSVYLETCDALVFPEEPKADVVMAD